MVLSDSEIKERLLLSKDHPKSIDISHIQSMNDLDFKLQPSSFDIAIGDNTEHNPADLVKVIDDNAERVQYGQPPNHIETCKHNANKWIVPPRTFLLGSSLEKICIPNDLIATLEGRSTTGRTGLSIHITAGFIDPGFQGQITFEMFNFRQVPIAIPFKQRIGQLVFEKVSSIPNHPYGTGNNKYQNQSGTTLPLPDEE